MDRVNNIIFHRNYQPCLLKNKNQEASRKFCHHDFEHMLTVARLTYLLLLEEGSPFISQEMAYAAGLLHDIGRWNEYQTTVDHAQHSAELAEPILIEAGFSLSERELIIKAILQHRIKKEADEHYSPLSKALRNADRLSRLCFCCAAREECKNMKQRVHIERLFC
ncbi:MAG TPA: HD domain-containing protein [Candidatus Limnocylindrales bacterium]|nr:HD domain-containing protein [Candidatus Limnocylindrales bacterium]